MAVAGVYRGCALRILANAVKSAFTLYFSIQHSTFSIFPMPQDDQLRRYEDLARRAGDLRSYL